MDMHGWASAWLALAVAYTSTGEIRRAGWLDRLVLYHKNHFVDEVKQLAPINIQASIEKAPVGYVDSPAWDYASVTRLLALIGTSEGTGPVRSALRRALSGAGAGGNLTLQASRRFMSRQKSYKFFPSLAQMQLSNMYYDVDTDADYAPDEEPSGGILSATAVVLVRNPVEARLPSARISVNLLKDILEARAVAARKMPTTTTTSGWTWTTKSVTVPIETTESPVTGPTTAGPNATEPTEPGTNVTAPATNASEPTTPGTNATEPAAPGTNATEPAAPGTNATEPAAPGTNATEPAASGTNATEPAAPGTNATEPAASGTNDTEPTL